MIVVGLIRLTALGATTLEAHLDRMQSFAKRALGRLKGGAA